MQKYWFRPKRFWHWFAAYYPSSWQGWLVSLTALWALIYLFQSVDRASHSTSDTLVAFAPPAIGILAIFDILTHFKGEYPYWWQRRFCAK